MVAHCFYKIAHGLNNAENPNWVNCVISNPKMFYRVSYQAVQLHAFVLTSRSHSTRKIRRNLTIFVPSRNNFTYKRMSPSAVLHRPNALTESAK